MNQTNKQFYNNHGQQPRLVQCFHSREEVKNFKAPSELSFATTEDYELTDKPLFAQIPSDDEQMSTMETADNTQLGDIVPMFECNLQHISIADIRAEFHLEWQCLADFHRRTTNPGDDTASARFVESTFNEELYRKTKPLFDSIFRINEQRNTYCCRLEELLANDMPVNRSSNNNNVILRNKEDQAVISKIQLCKDIIAKYHLFDINIADLIPEYDNYMMQQDSNGAPSFQQTADNLRNSVLNIDLLNDALRKSRQEKQAQAQAQAQNQMSVEQPKNIEIDASIVSGSIARKVINAGYSTVSDNQQQQQNVINSNEAQNQRSTIQPGAVRTENVAQTTATGGQENDMDASWGVLGGDFVKFADVKYEASIKILNRGNDINYTHHDVNELKSSSFTFSNTGYGTENHTEIEMVRNEILRLHQKSVRQYMKISEAIEAYNRKLCSTPRNADKYKDPKNIVEWQRKMADEHFINLMEFQMLSTEKIKHFEQLKQLETAMLNCYISSHHLNGRNVMFFGYICN